MNRKTFESQRLSQGLEQLGIDIGPQRFECLLDYMTLVRKWSRTYNLVSPRDLDLLVSRHLLDSLAVQKYLVGSQLFDVGSGAGFPGVPLAIVDPSLETVLVDSAGKKARFLSHASRELNLANITVLNERVEDVEHAEMPDCIVSRAFSSLSQFAQSVRHLARPDCKLLAMKGKLQQDEIDELPEWVNVELITPLDVPQVEGERHLVTLSIPAV